MWTSTVNRCNYWWDDSIKWGLSVVTAPTSEPVSLDEVKSSASISLSDDDPFLLRKITLISSSEDFCFDLWGAATAGRLWHCARESQYHHLARTGVEERAGTRLGSGPRGEHIVDE